MPGALLSFCNWAHMGPEGILGHVPHVAGIGINQMSPASSLKLTVVSLSTAEGLQIESNMNRPEEVHKSTREVSAAPLTRKNFPEHLLV